MMVDERGLFAVICAHLKGSLVFYDNMVTRETMPIAASFFAEDQFKGLAGSSGPSQSTMFGSLGVFSLVAVSELLLSRPVWFSTSGFFAGWKRWSSSVERPEKSGLLGSFEFSISRLIKNRTEEYEDTIKLEDGGRRGKQVEGTTSRVCRYILIFIS